VPVGDAGADVGQLGVRAGELAGPGPDLGREQQLAAGRRPQPVLHRREAALVGDLERPDLLDRVAPPLDADRVLLRRREDVEDAAPHRELAALLDQLDAGVGEVDEAADHGVEAAVHVLAGGQLDRLEVAQARDLRLEQAADRRDHHVQGTGCRVIGAGVGQPPQDRQAPPDRVRPR
jgi:hypothetical protein